GDEFRHVMLHLDARIDLEKEEASLVVEQELERAGIRVLPRARGVDHCAAKLAAHFFTDRDRRRFLEQLLVPALNRALALAEMHHRTVMIAEHLELDMAWVLEVFLEIHVADAERRFRFALGGLERLRELARGANHAHAATAAPGHRFDDDGIPELSRDLRRLFLAVDGTVASGQHRHARFLHGAPRARLVAEQPDHVRGRSDELDVARLADLREIRALRKETVTGMDGVGAGDFRRADDRGNAQITVCTPGGPDTDVLVREADMERVLIRFRIDGDGLDAQFPARADDAQRDFTAVRNQDLLEHSHQAGIRDAGS